MLMASPTLTVLLRLYLGICWRWARKMWAASAQIPFIEVVIVIVFLFQKFHSLFDMLGSLRRATCQHRSSIESCDCLLTFGSKLRAIVKCLIAAVLSRIILCSRPSMKCTFASSGAMFLRTCSSTRASRGCRKLMSARAFLNRASAERGSSSHARVYCTSAGCIFFIFSSTYDEQW